MKEKIWNHMTSVCQFVKHKGESGDAFSSLFSKITPRNLFVVLAFIGMSMGLVGSCNVKLNQGQMSGLSVFFSEFEHITHPKKHYQSPKTLSKWQVKAYTQSIINSPQILTDITSNEIKYIFGIPDLERMDLPSVIWQFTQSNCVLDMFFIADYIEDLPYEKVAHYEARTTDGKPVYDISACISSITASAQKPTENYSN